MLNKFYQKQQVIMTLLGLYDGLCDGVWGPKCVEAKRKWEMLDGFEPGVPNNGLPFNGRGKLPKGLNYLHKGLDIMFDKWDQTRADEILAAKGQLITVDMINAQVTGQQRTVPETVIEPVATISTHDKAPVPSSVLDVQDSVAVVTTTDTPQEEKVEEPVAETKAQSKNDNWTQRKNK